MPDAPLTIDIPMMQNAETYKVDHFLCVKRTKRKATAAQKVDDSAVQTVLSL